MLELHKRIVQFFAIVVNIIIWYHGEIHLNFFISNFYTFNLLESIIIKITFDQNMNLSQGMYHTDKTLEYFIEKKLKIRKIF